MSHMNNKPQRASTYYTSFRMNEQDASFAGVDTMEPYSTLPTDRKGYVYILMSLRDTSRTYVGQTIDLPKRLREHNSGRGAEDKTNRPFFIAGYICGVNNITRNERINIESSLRHAIDCLLNSGDYNVMSLIAQGDRVIERYNQGRDVKNTLMFVQTTQTYVYNDQVQGHGIQYADMTKVCI